MPCSSLQKRIWELATQTTVARLNVNLPVFYFRSLETPMVVYDVFSMVCSTVVKTIVHETSIDSKIQSAFWEGGSDWAWAQ